MSVWSELASRVRAVLFGGREDAELKDELAYHLELEVAANVARGMTADDAVRAARIKLGSMDRFTEEARAERGAQGVLEFVRDLRLSGRGMRRSPLFTAVVVLTLALGIGATTAVFGLVNRVLIQPLPTVERAEELVHVLMGESVNNWTGLSFDNFADLHAGATTFESLAGYAPASLQIAGPESPPEVMTGSAVVGDYFGTLGVQPLEGRLFNDAELAGRSSPFVVVLAVSAAERIFGEAGAVGRPVKINGHTFEVIGVTPPDFRGVNLLHTDDAWVPPAAYAELRHMDVGLHDRSSGLFREFFGRPAAGVTPEQAQQQLRSVMERLIAAYPVENELYEEYPPTVHEGLGIPPRMRSGLRTTLLLLLGVSGLVLLIACANVANLLIFRGVARRGEAAVRRALGASSWRLLRQNFSEGLLLALAGSAAGVLVAIWLTQFLSAEMIAGPLVDRLNVSWRVLAFTIAIAFVISIVFALVPMLLTRRLDVVTTLRHASRGQTGKMGVARTGLVVVQLGASAALLIVSLLLVQTIRALSGVTIGFDPDRVVAFSVSEGTQGYDRERGRLLQNQLLERTVALPQVEYAAITSEAPFSGMSNGGGMRLPEWPEEVRSLPVAVHWISEDFFAALGVAPLRGRSFTAAEVGDTVMRNVVINRSAAEQLFGTIDVVGRVMRGGWTLEPQTIVGVVDDLRHGALREPMEPTVYHPQATYWRSGFVLIVRTRGREARVEEPLRAILGSVDPDLPFSDVQLITEGVQQAMSRERFLGRVTGLLAAIAGVLAGIGLYGLLSYAVAQQTREIGVRMALGAGPRKVVMWVTARMLALTLAGIAIGVAGGVALGRLVQAQLFGVEPLNATAYGGAVAILLIVGLCAVAMPARAAVRVQPATALRAD